MITRARFSNYRMLKDVTLDFGQLNVLVGPNGVGKSSVLEALDLICRLGWKPFGSIFEDPSIFPREALRMRTRGAREPLTISIDGIGAKKKLRYSVALSLDFPGAEDADEQPAVIAGLDLTCGKQSVKTTPDHALNSTINGLFPELGALMDRSQMLQLNPAEIARGSSVLRRIENDGAGVAETLADMKLEHTERFEQVVASARKIIPSLKQVRFERKREVHGGIARALIVDMENARGIPAASVSGGTLIVLALLATVLQPARPTVLLLDEIEHGLHPAAMGALVDALRQILKNDPALQIIATSHSPYLLDHLSTDEIRIGVTGPDGSARFAKLSDHPEFEQWKRVMKPGEFWSSVGESWIAKEPGAPYARKPRKKKR